MKIVNRFGLMLIAVFAVMVHGCTDPKDEGDAASGKGAVTLFSEAAELNNKAMESEGPDKEKYLRATADKLGQAVEKDPALLEAQIALVNTLWELPDRQVEAVRMCEKLTTRFPGKHEIWTLAGDTYLKIFKWEDALNAFEKALDLGGDAADLHMKIGLAAGPAKDLELAFEAFDAAARAGADEVAVNFHLGLCYEGTQQYRMALDHYMMSLEGNSSYLPALNKLASAYMDNRLPGAPDLDKALKYAKKAFELRPSDIKVLANLVDILIIKKEYAPALKAVDTSITHNPDEPTLLKYRKALVELMNEDQETGEENNSNQKDQ